MRRILICTTYTKTKKGLVLRTNWTEQYHPDILRTWNIDPLICADTEGNKFEFTDIGLSNILEGRLDLDNIVIHVRILNY